MMTITLTRRKGVAKLRIEAWHDVPGVSDDLAAVGAAAILVLGQRGYRSRLTRDAPSTKEYVVTRYEDQTNKA